MTNPWTTNGQRAIYANSWIEVTEYDVVDPGGRPGIYGVVRPRAWAIGVIPVFPDGSTVLVGQHRYPLDKYSWEIPEGGGQKDRTPIDSARRELREETGLVAHSWHELQRLHLSNSVTDELAITFVAWDLEQGEAEPESTEDISVRRVAIADAIEMALAGELTDSMTVAGLIALEALARRRSLPSELGALLGRIGEP